MDINTFNVLYINVYSTILLLVLIVILYLKKDIYDFSSRLFTHMIIINALLSLLEALTFIVSGSENYYFIILHYSMNFIIFLLTPLIGFLWAVYLDYKILKKIQTFKYYFKYLIPFLIVVILLIANFYLPVVFSVDSNNVYSREPFIIVNFLLLYLLLAYMTYLVVKNRNKVEKHVVSIAFLFIFFPAVGGILQYFYYGVATLYSLFSLSIFSTYLALETVGSSKDYLTGLYTRKKSMEYMNELIKGNTNFGVLFIDLDDFKKINDEYGHNIGDNVLKIFAEVLSRVFHKIATVSRFGGDEFIIVKKGFSQEDYEFFKETIYKDISDNVDSELMSSNFRFSIGCSIFNVDSIKTAEAILVEADNNMYLHKAKNKNMKRRKNDILK